MEQFATYKPPQWANCLNHIPTTKLQLGTLPTPITTWKLPGTPNDFQVYIKRDDFTGSEVTGNKVRKLQFILAEAVQSGCRHILTTAALYSNHCRTTAALCARLGLTCHLILRSEVTDLDKLNYEGNLFLDRLFGANIYLTPPRSDGRVYTQSKLKELALKIQKETGEKTRDVCIGGTDETGIWGYIDCFEEIRQQGLEFDDIVCTCGSGGTVGGLAIANYLCGSPYRCHGISIRGDNSEIHAAINSILRSLGLADVNSEDIMSLYEEYRDPGYALNLPQQLEYIVKTANQTGVVLDNTYTGKAAYGLSHLLQNKPEVFKGRRVLFIHTGGMFSLQNEAVRKAVLPHAMVGKVSFLSDELPEM